MLSDPAFHHRGGSGAFRIEIYAAVPVHYRKAVAFVAGCSSNARRTQREPALALQSQPRCSFGLRTRFSAFARASGASRELYAADDVTSLSFVARFTLDRRQRLHSRPSRAPRPTRSSCASQFVERARHAVLEPSHGSTNTRPSTTAWPSPARPWPETGSRRRRRSPSVRGQRFAVPVHREQPHRFLDHLLHRSGPRTLRARAVSHGAPPPDRGGHPRREATPARAHLHRVHRERIRHEGGLARAAVGPWQFINGTARRYNLRINWWYDERCDVVASTYAASNYLRTSTASGATGSSPSPRTTAASTASRARSRGRRRTNFWQLDLPTADRALRAEVPGRALYHARAREVRVHDSRRVEPIRFDMVTVNEATDLDVLAQSARVPPPRSSGT